MKTVTMIFDADDAQVQAIGEALFEDTIFGRCIEIGAVGVGNSINAELVAALKDARPYVKAHATFGPNTRVQILLSEIDAAIEKAQGNG